MCIRDRYGACPGAVLAKQRALRDQLEREPVEFLTRRLESLLGDVRARLADFVGAQADDLILIPNATSGVNTVLRSLDLQADDELLTTDHEYNACRNALRWHEGRGVRVVVAHVPWPCPGPESVRDAVLGAVTPRTRLALIAHVTIPTGLSFPVRELVQLATAPGANVIITGR